jgi:hypothetical protein
VLAFTSRANRARRLLHTVAEDIYAHPRHHPHRHPCFLRRVQPHGDGNDDRIDRNGPVDGDWYYRDRNRYRRASDEYRHDIHHGDNRNHFDLGDNKLDRDVVIRSGVSLEVPETIRRITDETNARRSSHSHRRIRAQPRAVRLQHNPHDRNGGQQNHQYDVRHGQLQLRID